MDAIHVLGIAGSLRARSFNRALLRAAIGLAPDGMRITEYVGLREIPPYDADLDGEEKPGPVLRLREAIAGADALLFVSPEYNYGIPGVLKNAFDWASRGGESSPLWDRPVAIMGVSAAASGTRRMQSQLRQVCVFTRSPVMPAPEVLVTNARERFDGELRLTDETTTRLVKELLGNLLAWTRAMRTYREARGRT